MTLTREKLERIQTSATNRRVREIISAVKAGTLVSRPDFQRKLVWTNRDKLLFLDTLLEHLPFPEIYVCAGEVNTETAQGTEWLVDGQQRVSTIVSYFSGDPLLRLGASHVPYRDLPAKEQERFLEYILVVRDLGKLEIQDVREVFQRINSTQYGLNAMELANARWDGAIKKYVQRLAEHEFFATRGVFTASDIRRMLDASFCLSLVITMHSGYFDDTAEHEDYLERFNDEFPLENEFNGRVEKAMTFISSLDLQQKSRWWKKADLFTLLIEVDEAFSRGLDLDNNEVELALCNLETDIKLVAEHDEGIKRDATRFELVSKYSYAAAQGSNHRKSRRDRGEIVRSLLNASGVGAAAIPTASGHTKKLRK